MHSSFLGFGFPASANQAGLARERGLVRGSFETPEALSARPETQPSTASEASAPSERRRGLRFCCRSFLKAVERGILGVDAARRTRPRDSPWAPGSENAQMTPLPVIHEDETLENSLRGLHKGRNHGLGREVFIRTGELPGDTDGRSIIPREPKQLLHGRTLGNIAENLHDPRFMMTIFC